MTLWDENADSAFEEGQKSILSGVWLVTSHMDGAGPWTGLFLHEDDAKERALTVAQNLWEEFHEDDWPPQPPTWHEIYDEVLNRAGDCFDVITLEFKEIKT